MKNSLKIGLVFWMLFTAPGWAQQNDESYSQYWINGLVVNPGYTGSRETLSLLGQYRKKWTGVDGSPDSQVFSAHFPLKNDRVALGVLMLNQSYGLVKNTQASVNYAFRFRMGLGKMSLGMKAGMAMMNEDLIALQSGLADPTDPAFLASDNRRIRPSIGFGMYYYSKKFYVGFSIPEMINYSSVGSDSTFNLQLSFLPADYTYLFSSGVIVGNSPSFKWRPSAMVRYRTDYDALMVDLNSNFILLDNRIWLGGGYRFGGSYPNPVVLGNIQLYITPQLMLGYSYDYTLGNLNSSMNGVHEIILRYEFGYKINASNPRYF